METEKYKMGNEKFTYAQLIEYGFKVAVEGGYKYLYHENLELVTEDIPEHANFTEYPQHYVSPTRYPWAVITDIELNRRISK